MGAILGMGLMEAVGFSLYPERVAALLLSATASLCLLLAALGLYSVISYAISQRTQEFGGRIAMEASRLFAIGDTRECAADVAGASRGDCGGNRGASLFRQHAGGSEPDRSADLRRGSGVPDRRISAGELFARKARPANRSNRCATVFVNLRP